MKRSVYLSSADYKKKKKKKQPAQDGPDSVLGGRNNVADVMSSRNNQSLDSLRRETSGRADNSAMQDVDFDLAFEEIAGDEKRLSSSAGAMSRSSPPPRQGAVKIDSLIEMVRMRREQASRSLLIVPGYLA